MPATPYSQQSLLRELRRLISVSGPPAGAETAEGVQEGFDHVAWRALLEEHSDDWLAPDNWSGKALIAEAVGYGLTRVPWLGSALTVAALTEVAPANSEWVREVKSGRCTVCLCLGGPQRKSGNVTVEPGGTASGTLSTVMHGGAAQALLTIAADDRLTLLDLRSSTARHRHRAPFDLMQAGADLTLDRVPVLQIWDDPELGPRVRAQAAIFTAFEQLGGATRCLEITAAYVNGRYAFSEPIGANQAVKHKLANLLTEIELARSCAAHALWSLTRASAVTEAAAVAWVSANEAYKLASQEAVHLHGAFGTTWQCEAHLHLRRAHSLSNFLGSSVSWLELLADATWLHANTGR